MKPMVMAKTDAEFEAADQAVWTEMARRILKGAAPDSLDRTDAVSYTHLTLPTILLV